MRAPPPADDARRERADHPRVAALWPPQALDLPATHRRRLLRRRSSRSAPPPWPSPRVPLERSAPPATRPCPVLKTALELYNRYCYRRPALAPPSPLPSPPAPLSRRASAGFQCPRGAIAARQSSALRAVPRMKASSSAAAAVAGVPPAADVPSAAGDAVCVPATPAPGRRIRRPASLRASIKILLRTSVSALREPVGALVLLPQVGVEVTARPPARRPSWYTSAQAGGRFAVLVHHHLEAAS